MKTVALLLLAVLVCATHAAEITTLGGTAVTSDGNEDNPIATLVHGLIKGGVPGGVNTRDASGSPIVLANHNRIESSGADDDTEAEADHEEEGMKKNAAIGFKRDQAERAQIKSEERGKQSDIVTKKVMYEEKLKRDDAELRHASERAVKKGRLEMKTAVGVAQKQIDSANREVEDIGNKVNRDKEEEIERVKYSERTAQGKINFVYKKASERIGKLNKKVEMKIKSARRENQLRDDMEDAKLRAKNRAMMEKLRQKKLLERAEKRAEQAKEEDRKDKRESDYKSRERRQKNKDRDEQKYERMKKRRVERRAKFAERASKRRAERAKKVLKERVSKYTHIKDDSYTPSQGRQIMGASALANVGAYSYSFWVMPTGTVSHWANLFHKGAVNTQRNPGVWFYPGSTRLHVRSGDRNSWNNGADPSQALAPNMWSHVAFTHSSNRLLVYVNGHLSASANVGPALGNSGPLYASDPWHHAALCTMSDFRYYPRVLSQTEVRMILGERKHP